jgi:hypothetical protein
MICGVNLVAPPKPFPANPFDPVVDIQAGWTSVIPYGFSRAGEPKVQHNLAWQWWGESRNGARATIQYAHDKGLKVMLKPQVWVRGQGWAGDFTLETEADWQEWEKEYEGFLMPLVKLSDSLGVEMICIGTEYKQAVRLRPEFWRQLIRKIRTMYDGKLTYAANWDNYDKVSFWDELDYIGVDAYFPLSNHKTPSLKNLLLSWETPLKDLEKCSRKYDKPILFTEYGYRSADGAASSQWLTERDHTLPSNMKAQVNAYEALFRTFWKESWFAGGFLWNWFSDHAGAGGMDNNGYTPQNKPASKVIRAWYEQ